MIDRPGGRTTKKTEGGGEDPRWGQGLKRKSRRRVSQVERGQRKKRRKESLVESKKPKEEKKEVKTKVKKRDQTTRGKERSVPSFHEFPLGQRGRG